MRIHLLSKPAIRHGWLAALSDQVLAPALAAVHRSPEYKWIVAELAVESSVSRSVLDERFRNILGRPPIRYLTEWRMHLAKESLHHCGRRIFLDYPEWTKPAWIKSKTGFELVAGQDDPQFVLPFEATRRAS